MADIFNDSFTELTDDMFYTTTVAVAYMVEEALPNPPSGYSAFRIVSSAIIVAIVVVVIVVGNSLVCIAVTGKDRSLKSIQHWFLVSLAVADLMVGVLIMPLGIVNDLYGCWVFGPFLCLIWKVLDVLACTASILSLCLISLDRYFCITRPIQYAKWRTGRRARFMIGAIWVLSVAISVPPLFGWRDTDQTDEVSTLKRVCLKCKISEELGYILYSTMGSFFVPAFIMIVFYIKIWGAAKRHARTALRKPSYGKKSIATTQVPTASTRLTYELVDTEEPSARCNKAGINSSPMKANSLSPNVIIQQDCQSRLPSPEKSNGTIDIDEAPSQFEVSCAAPSFCEKSSSQPHEMSRRKRKIAQARERRATVILGIIMGTFLLCWFPFFGLYVIVALCGKPCDVPLLLFDFFFWIGYCNSALNPVIYTIFNRDFRKAFKRILHLK